MFARLDQLLNLFCFFSLLYVYVCIGHKLETLQITARFLDSKFCKTNSLHINVHSEYDCTHSGLMSGQLLEEIQDVKGRKVTRFSLFFIMFRELKGREEF